MSTLNPSSLLILDVDGVINATSPTLPTNVQYAPYKAVDITTKYDEGTYRIHYSEQLVRDVNYLSELVNVVYLTTWERDTIVLPDYLGLKHFPHITLGTEKSTPFEHPFTTMKGNALRAYLAENSQYTSTESTVIWVDDQLSSRESEWARENGITPLITNTRLGLLKRHVKNIYEEFGITYPFA